ncbi:MAG: hypothetical protein KAZ48_09630, partial [Candidatus Nanopelagicales bacterium]|nr:hypothetical protein [Candidatus Nanopelagicales bacterium]
TAGRVCAAQALARRTLTGREPFVAQRAASLGITVSDLATDCWTSPTRSSAFRSGGTHGPQQKE